jgi:Ca2+-binding RTX toxin-like protein
MIERLENRILNAIFEDGLGNVYVDGTNGADSIGVVVANDGTDYPSVFISVNGTISESTTLPAGTVYRVLISAGDGDDSVTASSAGYVGIDIDGGEGKDNILLTGGGSVWGGGGDDRLSISNSFYGEVHGGGGNDIITADGECDEAMLWGDDGNDYLDARACTNMGGIDLFGGANDDTLVGSAGGDYLHGGDGFDKAYGYGETPLEWDDYVSIESFYASAPRPPYRPPGA